jgi:hypothetical protein
MGSKSKKADRITYSRSMMTGIDQQLKAFNEAVLKNYNYMKSLATRKSKKSRGGTRRRRS